MKKILLDCGAHLGKGLRRQLEINKIDSSWKVYAWEANPYTYQSFLENSRFHHLDLTAYHAAVSNENGSIKFNIQRSTDKAGNDARFGTGSSIISLDKWRPAGKKPFVEEVEFVLFVALTIPLADNVEPSTAAPLTVNPPVTPNPPAVIFTLEANVATPVTEHTPGVVEVTSSKCPKESNPEF